MSSNTTDKFVPALKRHTFTAGGCSNGEHDQPAFNQGDHAGFSEEWEGYIYVPQEKECNIRVAADDNASFYLEAFPDKVAKLEARGPQGGGHYEYCDTVNLGVLAKGYYRAHVTYSNIEYTDGRNAARLAVEMNGHQVQIGNVSTKNTLDFSKARNLLTGYEPVNYITIAARDAIYVWKKFGEEVAKIQSYTDSCATRLSIGLNRAGYYLDTAPQANNVLLLNGGIWDNSILNSEDVELPSKEEHKHVVFSADSLASYVSATFGGYDFSTLADYRKACACDTGKDDIIIFHYPYDGDKGFGHIGMGTAPAFEEGNFWSDVDTVHIWVLHRPTWDIL